MKTDMLPLPLVRDFPQRNARPCLSWVCLTGLAALLLTGGGGSSVAAAAAGKVYYVAPDGDDARDGLAPERAWRSLEQVNAAELAAGDRVLFQRGGQWRGQLLPHSGNADAPLVYGAYGVGSKPSLLGSVALERAADWQPAGPGLWTTATLQPSPANRLSAELLRQIKLHREQGAAVEGKWTGDQYTLRCVKPGADRSHIQLYVAPFAIAAERVYQLRFRAKANRPVKIAPPSLMSSGAPWTSYAARGAPSSFAVGSDWTDCVQLYTSIKTSDAARLTFSLGKDLPAGAELTLADIGFYECTGEDRLPIDVGNIIFDHGAAWGAKKWNLADLQAERDYWYDPHAHRVVVRLDENPATRYNSVELALRKHVISQSGQSHVIYENLDVRYGAAHGIGGGSTHHITVRDCDFSWIGGGHQFTTPAGKPVRFGNGVEFWGNAHDCLVERCRLWEIYDAALTNQNKSAVVQQYNIVYRRNLIWNSEYSFEYWNRPQESLTHHIYFENNTCFGAGHGWGHTQRPDGGAGRHLCFYTNDCQTHDMYIRNNIFCQAANVAFDALWWKPETLADRRVIQLDYNCWLQPAGTMIRLKGQSYAQAEFSSYQQATGQEAHSLVADPLLVDPAGGARNFLLRPKSPCIAAGLAVENDTADFLQRPLPRGTAPDIGALQSAAHE